MVRYQQWSCSSSARYSEEIHKSWIFTLFYVHLVSGISTKFSTHPEESNTCSTEYHSILQIWQHQGNFSSLCKFCTKITSPGEILWIFIFCKELTNYPIVFHASLNKQCSTLVGFTVRFECEMDSCNKTKTLGWKPVISEGQESLAFYSIMVMAVSVVSFSV